MTDFDIDALPDDSWETVVSAGITLAQHMDGHRFALGDLALTVEKRYGRDSLGKFSGEIGLARVQTLREYRRVSARYSPNIRMEFSEALSWSHFQAACRAKDDAELWLARAADEGWPVAALSREIAAAIGAPVPPVKLWEGEGKFDLERIGASDYTGETGHLEYIIILNADDVPIKLEQRVRVVVYAVDKEAE